MLSRHAAEAGGDAGALSPPASAPCLDSMVQRLLVMLLAVCLTTMIALSQAIPRLLVTQSRRTSWEWRIWTVQIASQDFEDLEFKRKPKQSLYLVITRLGPSTYKERRGKNICLFYNHTEYSKWGFKVQKQTTYKVYVRYVPTTKMCFILSLREKVHRGHAARRHRTKELSSQLWGPQQQLNPH